MYLGQNRFIKENGSEIVEFQYKYTPVPKYMQLGKMIKTEKDKKVTQGLRSVLEEQTNDEFIPVSVCLSVVKLL